MAPKQDEGPKNFEPEAPRFLSPFHIDSENEQGDIDGDIDSDVDNYVDANHTTTLHEDIDKHASLRRRFLIEAREQLKVAVPTIQSMILTKLPWLISIRFAGGLGANELAAAALATTIYNVTGLSLSVGLSSAMTTLAGQAKGDLVRKLSSPESAVSSCSTRCVQEDSEQQVRSSARGIADGDGSADDDEEETVEPLLPLVFLYRGLMIQILFVVPIATWWLSGVDALLLSLGQPESLAAMTAEYLRFLTPGFAAYCIVWTMTTWLQCIGMVDVPLYSSMLGLALHVPMNWIFVYGVDLDYLGCAVATDIFQSVQAAFILVYVFGTAYGRRRVLQSTAAIAINRTQLSFWPEFKIAVSSLRGIFQYLMLAVPGIVAISEWWASEISIFLSGRLSPEPEAALGGMTLYQSINIFCFMLPVGFGVAGATRVSNLIGQGKPFDARFAGFTSVLCAGACSTCLGIMLLTVPHTFFPSLFAPDEDSVIRQAANTIPYLSAYIIADGLIYTLNSMVKGVGRQCVNVPIVLFAYWCVGLPLAYYNSFVRNDGDMMCEDSTFCGVVGLVAGMTTGTWVHMLLVASVVVFAIDWEHEAVKAQERLREA